MSLPLNIMRQIYGPFEQIPAPGFDKGVFINPYAKSAHERAAMFYLRRRNWKLFTACIRNLIIIERRERKTGEVLN